MVVLNFQAQNRVRESNENKQVHIARGLFRDQLTGSRKVSN